MTSVRSCTITVFHYGKLKIRETKISISDYREKDLPLTSHTLIFNQPYQINEIVVLDSRVKPQIPISFSRIYHFLSFRSLIIFQAFFLRRPFSRPRQFSPMKRSLSFLMALLQHPSPFSFNREHANRFFKSSVESKIRAMYGRACGRQIRFPSYLRKRNVDFINPFRRFKGNIFAGDENRVTFFRIEMMEPVKIILTPR